MGMIGDEPRKIHEIDPVQVPEPPSVPAPPAPAKEPEPVPA